jgi:hypothetical protein
MMCIGIGAVTASQAREVITADAAQLAIQPAVALIAVQSRKMHGASGPYDMAIGTTAGISGAVSVEPRSDGLEHRIVFQFDGAVTSIGAFSAVDVDENSYHVEAAFTNNEVTLTMTGIPDGKRVTVSLDGVNGSVNQFVSLGFLAGDINGSRAVNAVDIIALKAHTGVATGATNFIYDLNVDGRVNGLDLSLVKTKSGRVLPIKIIPSAPTIACTPPTTGNVAAPYSFLFDSTGTAPIVWSIRTGSLPPGLTLNPDTGALSGKPTAEGTFEFSVRAANGTLPNAVAPVPPAMFAITVLPVRPGVYSIEDFLIPEPSKIAKLITPRHPGLNGAGENINAWAVDPVRCSNTLPAIATSWHHNIDFADHGGKQNLDNFDMAPNESLTYQFVATSLGVGSITIGESAQAQLVSTFISLSSSPCDFDVTKASGPGRSYCYSAQPVENQLAYEVTNGPVSFMLNCKLIPGNTYYLNVRFHNGNDPADACAPRGGARCGGWLQIRR